MKPERDKLSAMLTTIWRRHTAKCPHTSKGRLYLKCACPLWGDGYADGERIFRRSLATRDMARARKKTLQMEAAGDRVLKPIADAREAFLAHCTSQGLADGSMRKYRNVLGKLATYCKENGVDTIDELTIDVLDGFRSSRQIAPITSSKELELLRVFCSFCVDRKWMETNHARKIKGPKKLKPNEVVPYTPAEVQCMIAASLQIGQSAYERLRAHAMLLALRYTALRISDVALLQRSRFSWDGSFWRMFLYTEKNGQPIFLRVPTAMKDAFDLVPNPMGAEPDCPFYFWSTKGGKRSVVRRTERTLRFVFKRAHVPNAHAHRFRHTLATELLGGGASFEEVADILGNTPEIVRKHYAKWSPARQARIDDLMERMHAPTAVEEPAVRTLIQ